MRRLAWLPLLLLAACADEGPSQVLRGQEPAQTRLVVEQTTDRTQTWTLTCDPPGGDHPAPAAACGALAGLREPFAPLPADAVCTEQYGGDQTARVTGTYRGAPLALELSRVNGCSISQWDRLGPLLPGPVGVDLPK